MRSNKFTGALPAFETVKKGNTFLTVRFSATILISVLFLLHFGFAKGHRSDSYKNDSSDTLLFFGFDLSQVKLIDYERSMADFRPHQVALDSYLEKKFSNKRFEDLAHANTVIYDYRLINQVNYESAAATYPHIHEQLLSEKSLELMVSQYRISGYNGKGYVLIFDRFDRAYHEVTLHLVMFDIATGKLLCSHRVTSKSGNRHRSPDDWYYSSYVAAVRAVKNIAIWEKKGCDALKDSTRIREMQSFRPGIFRNEYDELPLTFGFGPVLGLSNSVISGGFHFSGDIYHILFGARMMLNPLVGFGNESRNETAFYLGYRYRKDKYSFSAGSGWGKVEYFCTSGLNSDCEQYKEETLNSIPLHLEYAYYPKPMIGFGISVEAAFTSRTPNIGIFAGLKIGIFGNPKKWKEEE